jgi:hypothetical protein
LQLRQRGDLGLIKNTEAIKERRAGEKMINKYIARKVEILPLVVRF